MPSYYNAQPQQGQPDETQTGWIQPDQTPPPVLRIPMGSGPRVYMPASQGGGGQGLGDAASMKKIGDLLKRKWGDTVHVTSTDPDPDAPYLSEAAGIDGGDGGAAAPDVSVDPDPDIMYLGGT